MQITCQISLSGIGDRLGNKFDKSSDLFSFFAVLMADNPERMTETEVQVKPLQIGIAAGDNIWLQSDSHALLR